MENIIILPIFVVFCYYLYKYIKHKQLLEDMEEEIKILENNKPNYREPIHKIYEQWLKETKRGGSVLVGSSIREFLDYYENKNKL